jgi:hypothetical protein
MPDLERCINFHPSLQRSPFPVAGDSNAPQPVMKMRIFLKGPSFLDIPSSRGTIIVSQDGLHLAPENSALFSNIDTV